MAIIPNLTRLCALGHGSTATVTLAIDPTSGRLFAVKSAELSLSSPLQHEHRILSGLSCPHIISNYGFYTADSHCHLLLEFAQGGSLYNRIGKHAKQCLGEDEIRSCVRDILLGLSYLHSNSISHGDIKSRNILIDSNGRAKIADFGTAVRKSEKAPPLFSGTPAFMAPEVARGEERGTEADIWALGCTIIEMLTGKAPWHGVLKDQDIMAVVYRIGYTSDSLPEIPDYLSEECRDFLRNCLRRDPNERLSAEQLLRHKFVQFRNNSDCCEISSPQSALDFGMVFSESETETETETEEEFENEEMGSDPINRIRELAGPGSVNCSFDSEDDDDDQNWVEVRNLNYYLEETGEDPEIVTRVDSFHYVEDVSLINSDFDDYVLEGVISHNKWSDLDAVCKLNSINNRIANSDSDHILSISFSSPLSFFFCIYFCTLIPILVKYLQKVLFFFEIADIYLFIKFDVI